MNAVGLRRLALHVVLAAAWPALARAQGTDSATARLSFAVTFDVSSFAQNAANVSQVDAVPTTGVFRMSRVIVDGFVAQPRPWRYKVEIDVDALARDPAHPFGVHDLAVIVPIGSGMELAVGRQKEGATQQTMMSSHSLALTEGPASLSAFVPSRNDGVRLLGGVARRARWSIGWFDQYLFAAGPRRSDASEYVGRVFRALTDADTSRRLLQLGATAVVGGAPDGSLRFRSRPETFSAPDYVDTKSFTASGTTTFGFDALAQRGAVSMSVEVLLQRAIRPDSATAKFGGVYLEAAWRPGGQSRGYDAGNGCFSHVRVHHRAAWEIAARASHIDLTSAGIDGGMFDRGSVAVSWLTRSDFRAELEYGYGRLARAGMVGHTGFTTARVQWELR